MRKIIKITESQSKILNRLIFEGLKFKRDSTNHDKRIVSYVPGKNSKIDDTIFNDDKSLKVHKLLLPKSNIMSYNLYDIKSMDVNKALKHGIDTKKRSVSRDEKSMSQSLHPKGWSLSKGD